MKYYKEARHAVLLGSVEEEAHPKRDDNRATQVTEKVLSTKTVVKSRTRGGGKCCICFDPLSIQNLSVIVFFCCHAYHTTCLTESNSSGVSASRGVQASDYDDDGDDDDNVQSGGFRMRCILCTTAAA